MKYIIELTEREMQLIKQSVAIHEDHVLSIISSPDKTTDALKKLLEELADLQNLLT